MAQSPPPRFNMMQSDFQFLHNLTQRLLHSHPHSREVDIVFSTGAVPLPVHVPFDEHNYHVADDIPQHGLSNEVIAAIPIHVARGEMKKEVCAVCQNTFQQDRFYRQLSCGHAFHPQCIGEWLSRSIQCPTCRNPVKK